MTGSETPTGARFLPDLTDGPHRATTCWTFANLGALAALSLGSQGEWKTAFSTRAPVVEVRELVSA